MVQVKEFSVTKEEEKFYIDCLLKDLPINVKIELDEKQFSGFRGALKRGKENETSGKVYIFNKIGYISFPTTFVFFPEKNLIYTKLLALRLPAGFSDILANTIQ